MSQHDPSKIEEYQIILQKNPRSPIFAIVAESYRKMGLLEEALEITTRGIRHNPEYVTGLVAHAKTLYELKDYRDAITILTKAHTLNRENIIALRLLGHCYIKVKQHGKALESFKKLLILKPDDKTAIDFIKKWEFLDNADFELNSADFQMEDIGRWISQLPSEHAATHIIDSFMSHDDFKTAEEILKAALITWPNSSELEKRMNIVRSTNNLYDDQIDPKLVEIQKKKAFYERCLQRIEQIKSVDHKHTN